ncbi:MAG: cryptochrome/photolyase family protein, partial [Acidimicrobiia bacterium]|nr:cryptochrome/photolyase family protein [Acidimicrobiia bacterium]
MDTVWVLGDQLNRRITSLEGRSTDDTRVLLIESRAKISSKPFHRQRLHLVLTAM